MVRNLKGEQNIIDENQTGYWEVYKFTYNDGLKQHITGATFPRRGNTSPEVMYALNQIKKIFIEAIGIFSTWQFMLAFLLTWNKEKFIKSFNDVGSRILGTYINYAWIDGKKHYDYLSPVAQELQNITNDFLINLGIEETDSLIFAEIFSNFIEYDDAYRFRVEDLFSISSSKELRKRPIREIRRMLKKAKERDNPDVSKKFYKIGKIFSFLLLIPKVRKAFVTALENSDYNKLRIDNIEFYWMCMREDYNYGGFTNKERKSIMIENGWDVPTLIKK